jgi:hypothetical protein
MRTDELIAALAHGLEPVPPHAARRRLGAAFAAGALLAGLGMLTLLGMNPELGAYSRRAMFWVKVGVPAGVAVVGMLALERLARPGVSLGGLAFGLFMPFALVWLLGVAALLRAAPGTRGELLLGATWFYCPFYVAVLALPAFAGALWGLRSLAPTRLRLAGAMAGLAAGAVGAWAYALHCPELAAPFIATWYVIGMGVPAVVGAVVGPRLLRW